MLTSNLQNTMTTVAVMKDTNKSLKKEFGKVDVDKVERMQDEMAEFMEMGNEIQESLGRAWDVPEEVDEEELDAELEALGEEVEWEGPVGGQGEGVPGFMQDEVPTFVDEPPEQAGKVREAAG